MLEEQSLLNEYTARRTEFENKIKAHSSYMQENARPKIDVRCEVDKFRGFLKDVISFVPDFILQAEKPRLHYFEEEQNTLLVHDLSS